MKFLPFAVLLAASSVFAADISDLGSNVSSQLTQIIDLLRSVTPLLALGLFVLAGLVYAIGQVFDAPTRQKAQNWAMAIIIGTIIGVLIVVVAPFLVNWLVAFSPSS